jgi:hypothetical protein
VSNADSIKYNAKINPFQEIRQSLTNGRCSTDINFNTVVKPNTNCTEDETVLKGSERFNKYKRVNHDIL